MRNPEFGQVAKQAAKIVGKGILASVIGVGSLPALPDYGVQADSGDQPCVKLGFTPDAILNDGIDATFLEIAVLEACRSGLLRVEAGFDAGLTIDGQPGGTGPDLLLKDDGRGGDKIAGDWVFSSGVIRRAPGWPVSSYEGINGLAAVVAAQTKLVYSDGSVKRPDNAGLFILDKSTLILKPSPRSISVQTTPHVINMSDQSSAAAQILRRLDGEQDLRGLINKLYGLTPGSDPFSDPFNVLMITNDKKIFVTPNSGMVNGINGLSQSLRVDFTGTNSPYHPETDIAKLFGSQGNLRHLVFAQEPLASSTAFHETVHWPAAFLKESLGLNSGGHWKINMSPGGRVGGTTWVDNRDGTFTSLGFSHISGKLSRLEQYLWGWIPPEQVPPVYVALNEDQPFWQEGAIIRGPFKVVTIQDIIAEHGLRTPGPESALRNLKVGYVYTTTGRLATATEMTARELLAQRLPILWNQATDGQSTMEFVIPPEPGPAIIEPFAGKTLDSLGTTLRFTPNPNIKQFQIQVIPYNNDGPGINLIIGDQQMVQSGKFIVPPPELGRGNYVMLPGGMSYTWRVRTTSSTNPNIKEDDSSWSAWSQDTFRTPKRDSSKIDLVTLQETDNRTPTLTWNNRDTDVFYYEVQVSKDPNFETDPAKATAAVYWELRHGGVTNPQNSYTIPKEFPLEKGTTYYWRVRPRVQGDGTPVEWSAIGSFKTSADAIVQTYSPELVDEDYGNGIIGPSKEQLDEYGTPNPEVASLTARNSALARVYYTENGGVFIPEAVLPRKEDLTPAA